MGFIPTAASHDARGVAFPADGTLLRHRRRPRDRRAPSSPTDLAFGLGQGGRRRAGTPRRRAIPRSSWGATRAPPASGWRTRWSRASARRGATRSSPASSPRPRSRSSTMDLGASSGVVISASHNPPEYNGIKFFAGNGMKLARRARGRDRGCAGATPTEPAVARGQTLPIGDARERYLDHLRRRRRGAAGRHDGRGGLRERRGVRARARVAPPPRRHRRSRSTRIPTAGTSTTGAARSTPRWWRPRSCAWAPTRASRTTATPTARCSRTPTGAIVDGDQVLAACAVGLKRAGRLDREHRRDDGDGEPRVPPRDARGGHRRRSRRRSGTATFSRTMVRTGAVLGGEQSGHVIFREHATTGDGLLTAVRFLSLAAAHRTHRRVRWPR